MFSSENVNGGFSAIGSEELETVNGGLDPVSALLLGFTIGATIGTIVGKSGK